MFLAQGSANDAGKKRCDLDERGEPDIGGAAQTAPTQAMCVSLPAAAERATAANSVIHVLPVITARNGSQETDLLL